MSARRKNCLPCLNPKRGRRNPDEDEAVLQDLAWASGERVGVLAAAQGATIGSLTCAPGEVLQVASQAFAGGGAFTRGQLARELAGRKGCRGRRLAPATAEREVGKAIKTFAEKGLVRVVGHERTNDGRQGAERFMLTERGENLAVGTRLVRAQKFGEDAVEAEIARFEAEALAAEGERLYGRRAQARKAALARLRTARRLTKKAQVKGRTRTIVMPHAPSPYGPECKLCGIKHSLKAHRSHSTPGVTSTGEAVARGRARKTAARKPAPKVPARHAPASVPKADESTLPAFARLVLATARDEGRRTGDDSILITIVHRGYRARGGSLGLAAFKKRLLDANKAGLVQLARADLVGDLDRREVEASEVKHLTASFHLIRTDDRKSNPRRPSVKKKRAKKKATAKRKAAQRRVAKKAARKTVSRQKRSRARARKPAGRAKATRNNPRSPEATLDLLAKATHYVGAMARSRTRSERANAAEQARLYLAEVERYPSALTPSMRALAKRVKDSIKAAWKAPLNVSAQKNPLLGVLSTGNPATQVGRKVRWKDMPASIRNSPAARKAAMIAARADGIPLEELEGEVVLAPPGTANHVSIVGELDSIRYKALTKSRRAKTSRGQRIVWDHAAGDHGHGRRRTKPQLVVHDPRSGATVLASRRGTRAGYSSRRGLTG